MDRSSHHLPPLDWLRTFEAAARHEKFSAAAQELNLTQAAVSQQIRKLEAWLGVALFNRLPRSVELTLQGDAYLPHVRQAIDILNRGTGDLFASKNVRQVTIAAPASYNGLWLAPRIGMIREMFPHIHPHIFSIHRNADYESIKADLEIRFGLGDRDWGDGSLLFKEVLSPVCSAGLQKSLRSDHWSDAQIFALTGLRSGWAEWCAQEGRGRHIDPNVRFDSLATALEAVGAGAGILLASVPLLTGKFLRGELVRLSEVELEMAEGYWLVKPRDRRVDPGVEALCEYLEAQTGVELSD
ncbi:MAG: LysR family transcriptional regulator [Pseudomonadota bacterium]